MVLQLGARGGGGGGRRGWFAVLPQVIEGAEDPGHGEDENGVGPNPAHHERLRALGDPLRVCDVLSVMMRMMMKPCAVNSLSRLELR